MRMTDMMRAVMPYLGGLWTLPWIPVGFLVTVLLSRWLGEERVHAGMRRTGLVLLFVFIPLLLFRIFLNIDFGRQELCFAAVTVVVLVLMYLISWMFGRLEAGDLELRGDRRRTFVKTILTNQGRSAAFVGGMILAIDEWSVPAAIYISLVGIGLFAVIPHMLSVMHDREVRDGDSEKVSALPWSLRMYPWYLVSFPVAAVALHGHTGITMSDLGETGIVLHFLSALTIPAGLYYVGSGMHPEQLRLGEMRKMFSLTRGSSSGRELHWSIARNSFFSTLIVTPAVLCLIFGALMYAGLVAKEWFAVIVLNSIMPITSTNMFLVPYGIDRRGTALAITWTTLVSVPVLILLIPVFVRFFT
ncbi:MAG: hypothetical protein R6U36_06090 [Candidatus Fermentibacteraceae bacterium]